MKKSILGRGSVVGVYRGCSEIDLTGQDSVGEFSSVTQLCPTLCDPLDCSTPGFPLHYQLLELTQTHVHRVSDAIQASHTLPSPSPLPLEPDCEETQKPFIEFELYPLGKRWALGIFSEGEGFDKGRLGRFTCQPQGQ